MRSLRVLFIGNSHTYFNDMPHLFAEDARAAGYEPSVTMLAHGGWKLSQHMGEPEVLFNIRYGSYDYVILQEHAHPFPPKNEYLDAVTKLCTLAREAGSTPVIYGTWSMKSQPEKQEEMDETHLLASGETGALLAPVGRSWAERLHQSGAGLYFTDGAHASPEGSALAARVIWETIYNDIRKNKEK